MPTPHERAERLELVNSMFVGPLHGIVGFTPGFPPEAIAIYVAAIAWKSADEIMVAIDALP